MHESDESVSADVASDVATGIAEPDWAGAMQKAMREPDEGDDADQADVATRALREARQMWIDPEVARRRADGRIGEEFQLRRAQVIMSVDAPTLVRLNDEVMLHVKVLLAGGRTIQPGEDVLESDVADIQSMTLTAADANAVHFTFMVMGERTFVGWDFRYNAARSATTVRRADEFLAAASDCISADPPRLAAFVDTLLAAVELTAKARLLLLPKRDIIESKNHGYLIGQYNLWSKLDATAEKFPKLLNDLSARRKPARFLEGELTLTKTEAEEMLATATEMLKMVASAIPERPALTA